MAFLAQVIFGVFDGLPVLCLAGLLVWAGNFGAVVAHLDGQQWQAVRGFERVCKTTGAPGKLGARFFTQGGVMRLGMTGAELVVLQSWNRGSRGVITALTLGTALALVGCSGSQGERILMKGCKEGGVNDKDCQCATQKVGTRYDLKNLQEFMNDRAIPMQTLQMDFVKALAMCRQAG